MPDAGGALRLEIVQVPGEKLGPEAPDVRSTHLHHRAADLVLEDIERAHRASDTASGRTVKRGAAHEHILGAKTECDHCIRPAPDAAIKHYGELVARGGRDGGQHLDGSWRLVELSAAVVRHHDAVAA